MAETRSIMTVEELSRATGGSCLGNFAPESGCCSVSIDSRTVTEGSLFVPLMGENQDGHRYIPEALDSGASVIFVDVAHGEGSASMFSQLAKQHDAAIIMVEDTLKALQDAAKAYVRKFPALKKIAITGSSGKTTTKELAAAIFSRKYRVIANAGNLNSETGLPLSVFRIRDDHEVGIFELGMNRRGEMREIADVLNPHTALVTNIGTAHIGILGTREAIAEEKKAVFSFFSGESTGFVSETDDFREFLVSGVCGTFETFGPDSTPGIQGTESLGLEGWIIRYEGEKIRFSMPGPYNLVNAFAAISLARNYAIDPATIRDGLESVQTLFGRTEIVRGAVTAIFDYYNANPQSMEEAMRFCDELQWAGGKIFVLGSMLELGSVAPEAHRAVCDAADKSTAEHIILFGEDMINAGRSMNWTHRSVFFADTMEALAEHVSSVLEKNTLVFIKGSRGMALERLRPVLEHFSSREVHA